MSSGPRARGLLRPVHSPRNAFPGEVDSAGVAARRAVCVALLAVAVVCLHWRSAAAQSPDEVSIQTIRLGSGLAILVGRGGNIGVLVGPDGALLVDDQFAPLTASIRAAVAELGGESIRFVLNTHWHGDHTGGNENLAKQGAVIVSHANVRRRMSQEQWNPLREIATPPSPPAALPVVTFEAGLTLHWSGQQIDVLHVEPAHTDGDAIVVFRDANVVHLGDVYFNGFYPYIDLATGGSVDGLLAAVDRGLALCDAETRIIPGHGPLSNRAELQRYREMLATVRDAIRRAIGEGQTLDQVLAARPTADFDEKWGKGFLSPEDFVRILYASLSAAPSRPGTFLPK